MVCETDNFVHFRATLHVKTKLKSLVAGPTKWRIVQARRHVAVEGKGGSEEREPVILYLLDKEKSVISWIFSVVPIMFNTLLMARESLKCQQLNPSRYPIWYELGRMVKLYQLYCREVEFLS